MAVWKPGRGIPPDTESAIFWSWTSQHPELWEIHFCCLNHSFSCCWLVLAATAKSLQSCPALCDPIDGSPPGSSIPGILQARTLEWVAISFSYAWKWKMKMKVKPLSRVRLLFATPWTAAYQAPPAMVFSRQEYWSGVPSPSPWLVLSHVQFFCDRMDVALQAPLSMGFS